MAIYEQDVRDRALAIYKKKHSMRAVSKELGIPYWTIWKWFSRGQIVYMGNRKPTELREKAIQMYKDGEVAAKCARFAKVTESTFRRWLSQAGVNRGDLRKFDHLKAFEVYRKLKSIRKTAEYFGVSKSAIHRVLT